MQSYKLYVSFKNNMWLVCTMDSQKKQIWPVPWATQNSDQGWGANVPMIFLLYPYYVIVLQEMSPLYSIPIVSAW